MVCASGGQQSDSSGVEVRPVLRFRDGLPYPPAAAEHDARRWLEAAEDCDVAWSIDRPPPARPPCPWVLTLGTVSYEAPIHTLLNWRWAALVAPSPFAAERARTLLGDGAMRAPEVIANPVDLVAGDPDAMRARLALPPDARCLLFPHRADPEKGFGVALRALAELVRADARFVLLVPREPDALDPGFYDRLEREAAGLGLGEHVRIHDWIERPELGAYLGLGERTLTLSRLPESFGLVPVESVACGTPAISTSSGALATLLPPGHGITHVPVGGVGEVVSAVLAPPDPAQLARGRELVERRYGLSSAVDGYRAVFERLCARARTGP
jgi:glycosyltransferase involved in cell wall biosynthesis